jgi:two-component system chemotaxis response regulator CheB
MLTPTPVLTSAPLRVLVVEDSLTIRKYLVKVLQANGLEVVGEAADGLRAVELCMQLKPQVVTMDMILPGLSGLAATGEIMAYSPTPILIVSASVNRGEVFQTYEALAAGAVDVLDKIKLGETSAAWEQRFVAAVRMAARIKVITHPRARLLRMSGARNLDTAQALPLKPIVSIQSASPSQPASYRGASSPVTAPQGKADLIAIGASTGGPAAISEILRSLSPDFPIPILIVLHISEMFAFAFAEWLNTLSPIPARYAIDGESLPLPGKPQILLAPAGRHLTVEAGRLRLSEAAERNSCRPSIDVLFESLALAPSRRSVLCLLTGMGKDGAAGMLAGREAGLQTVAQDEASCVIFGMPAEAIRLRAAERVLPLQDIAPFLNSFTSAAKASMVRSTRESRGNSLTLKGSS